MCRIHYEDGTTLDVRMTPALNWVSAILGLPVVVLTIWEAISPGAESVVLWSSVFHAAVYFYTGYALLRYMFADHIVTTDPRRLCFDRLRVRSSVEWRASNSQSLFGSLSDECCALWAHARVSLPSLCGFLLRALSDTLHWEIVEGKHQQKPCLSCATTLSISHLTVCPDVRRDRQDASGALRLLFGAASDRMANRVRSATGDDSLRELLALVGILHASSPAAEVAAMIGIVNTSSIKDVLRRYGVDRSRYDPFCASLRSVLLNWTAQAWARLGGRL